MGKKKSLYQIFAENLKSDAKKKMGAKNTYEKSGGTTDAGKKKPKKK
jgi:hypothetical protein